jgi:hypothetical protein
MKTAVAIALMTMGVAIAGVWTRDIVASDHVDRSQGLLAARDRDAGTLLWPHWIAEYATAAALVAGAIGLLTDASWADTVAALAIGALLYTSATSLGWALAEPDRRAYAYPMAVGVIVGVVGTVWLLV